MKKFNWKSKKFIGTLLTLAALGFGVPPVFVPLATEAVCDQVECAA